MKYLTFYKKSYHPSQIAPGLISNRRTLLKKQELKPMQFAYWASRRVEDRTLTLLDLKQLEGNKTHTRFLLTDFLLPTIS